jgi:hypothetical protein
MDEGALPTNFPSISMSAPDGLDEMASSVAPPVVLMAEPLATVVCGCESFAFSSA